MGSCFSTNCRCYCNNRSSSNESTNNSRTNQQQQQRNRTSSVSNNFSSISSDQQQHHHLNLQQLQHHQQQQQPNGSFIITSDTISINQVPTGRNKRLKKDKCKWKSDISLNEQELELKRDEFWDTAPAFGGRIEIWNALKAVCNAIDSSQNYELAQAIIDSAQIILPNGSLNDCYDELGNHYQLPNYVIIKPVNLKKNKLNITPTTTTTITTSQQTTTTTTTTDNQQQELQIKFRLSNNLSNSDLKLTFNLNSTIEDVKKKIFEIKQIEPQRQRMYFGGKLLVDRVKLKDIRLQKNFVIQVIVREDPQQQQVQQSTTTNTTTT